MSMPALSLVKIKKNEGWVQCRVGHIIKDIEHGVGLLRSKIKNPRKKYYLKININSSFLDRIHSEKSLTNFFQIERNTIVVTFFRLITNQTDFRLFHNQKESCHYDRIPFTSAIQL